ncbi:ferritin [Ichthyobacterium seriolicida]|uniref:Ferritin n=1 Tax=Ichthyobacterium seriolicida TaxID=242600 RepID=A0A1J1ED28_9FLAO|nr:ferritin [Ichthyobacterium seriolicida]BAV95424.1 ferritin [Ichthyobacterium seriolicida]
MLSKNIIKDLNQQIKMEAMASQIYLSMACWAEEQGYEGVSTFLYGHAEEERGHMLKIIKYINERGGGVVVPSLEAPQEDFESLNNLFQMLYDHEVKVSENINELVFKSLQEKDYATHNFLQWFVSEQVEEETLAKTILDKIGLIGNDKGGLYLFDRDLKNISSSVH